jgi:hypothetical protein
MTDDAFRLASDPPRPRPAEFHDSEQRRQRALFAGLDVLPGQLDLFSTDGELEKISPTSV